MLFSALNDKAKYINHKKKRNFNACYYYSVVHKGLSYTVFTVKGQSIYMEKQVGL